MTLTSSRANFRAYLTGATIKVLACCMFAAFASHASFAAASSAAETSAAPSAVRTVSIHAKKFEFVPTEITLTKGQTVKLELTSDDVEHSLVVKGLGINGDMVKGDVTEVTVTPQHTGDFAGKCGKFCGLGHHKMHFVVHVVQP